MTNTLQFIYNHPLNKKKKIRSVLNFLKWQISSRLWDGSFVFEWINDSKLVIKRGMTGATGNIYVGLMEYEDMSFLLHYLHEDDLFFDIGANVGVYTVLASKVKHANTVCIEPLPLTYEKLRDNIQINRLDNVTSLNIGLSYEKSKLHFTTDKDTMNGVVIASDANNQEEVDVDTLDNISKLYGVPRVIKIDVEGFEANVLKGAHNVLKDEKLEVIIIELNGSGIKYGFSDDEIHNDLKKLEFNAFKYIPLERKLIKLEKHGTTHNTIYIREAVLANIEIAIKNANSFKCHELFI
ncbi:MAG: FkbM family methyltransferase [Sulfuricurvum sp.]|nr:FkbM family methyltransferase [Sulfuricurvum sp.]MDP3023109.1 FkbM family methyltransferase [Sulfuricurvum sp.]